uniref:Nucleolar protein 16 n=1 Tax=Eucampia antarctica TaxID=49252 RepID=A0A7S2REA6_9STRA|mmetsp:Transcript_20933/g.20136  ORF Transcript_20933/g.20136 Transcript_20933/m.20136 type:complete len:179 (+) Transcript_20933:45-581(+)|eukprot:CAMPEP_0197824918 /NCGR_PEP_ID=MMETSP1437-20131217/2103_1 /TAXON_ID=49252 ORGANISM="Eucampia antarctica, Strain CCMP1452" /NCGR_SAMPLE_ID=MMETSP1437 /ASSEMBLY_ACC=CAM_ASM_001096 /LENGTH=178 /DNA_ID=CAMNT_0043424727 /DNA_START=38 /DNA_END=574 /DNA_ORIENTATION=-
MVKHGTNKKRRAGRTGKTKLKNGTYRKFKPTEITNHIIREHWDPSKTPTANLKSMGLTANVNNDINSRGLTLVHKDDAGTTNNKAVEVFDIPESDIIPKKTLANRMLPMSIEDQKYVAKCMEKHGNDYLKMARDMKFNDMQHTENKLRKLGARFLLLSEGHRRVEVPSTVQHLVASHS